MHQCMAKFRKKTILMLIVVTVLFGSISLWIVQHRTVTIKTNHDNRKQPNSIVGSFSCQSKSSPEIATAWAFSRTLTQEVVQNIQTIHTKFDAPVVVFCGTLQCMQAIQEFNNLCITAQALVITELVKDTSLEKWIGRNPLNKVLAGVEFEDHLQEVVRLGILWQQGGIFIDPMIRITSTTPSTFLCENGWISKAETHVTLDIACFPQHHPFIKLLADNFVRFYPKEGKVSLPFNFNYNNLFKTTYQEYSSKTGHNVANYSVEFEKLHPTSLGIQHFGTLSYNFRVRKIGIANLGDEIQGFPGMQFLPYVDTFMERDRMDTLSRKEPVSMFFSAWWGDKTMKWPPPSNIEPIMMSMHIGKLVHDLWSRHINYLKQREPIGSRDTSTVDFLQKNGIETYFSACMTLMLRNPHFGKIRTDKIYLTDVKDDAIKLLPADIQEKGIPIYHNANVRKHSVERFTEAFELLESYASAKLVITQRIHCALPCVAMGTPVIFINSAYLPGGGGASNAASERTSGLTPMFHMASMYAMSPEESKQWFQNFNWSNPPPNPNPQMMMRFRATFWNVIRQKQTLYDAARKFGMIPLPHPPTDATSSRELTFHLIFSAVAEDFSWIHWRMVESIFYHHPFATIKLHSNTLKQATFDVLTEAGYIIVVEKCDLNEYLKRAKGFVTNLQDIEAENMYESVLRFLILYEYGGIYMDMNTIVLNPVDRLRNVIGWENPSQNSLSGTFMIFDKGNLFLHECITTFAQEQSVTEASLQSLLTNVWKKKTYTSSAVTMLGDHAFNPLLKSATVKCFEKISEDELNIFDENTYAVRVPSSHVIQNQLEVDNGKLSSGTLCKYILNTYCVLCNNQY